MVAGGDGLKNEMILDIEYIHHYPLPLCVHGTYFEINAIGTQKGGVFALNIGCIFPASKLSRINCFFGKYNTLQRYQIISCGAELSERYGSVGSIFDTTTGDDIIQNNACVCNINAVILLSLRMAPDV